MTECERLVDEGIITDSFLHEEVRDNFRISVDQKKMWAIQLDILRVIIELCQKMNLRYWVFGGTMLGAVRHHGFIPWDDDIDVCMPREDYNRLMTEKPILPEPYFFRTTETDNEYYYSYLGICNCNTTYIGFMGDSNCHKGMQVSIIPLDGVSNNLFFEKIRFKTLKALSVLGHAYAFNVNPHPISKALHVVLHIINFDINKLFKLTNKISEIVTWKDVDKVGLVIYSAYSFNKSIYYKDDFSETIYLPFEGMTVAVPKGYDRILRIQWGDYMMFPPIEQRKAKHVAEHDMDVPYRKYIAK